MITSEPPPVIIIGAGVSGLAATKSCLEEDLTVICFEATDSIGGLWNYREDGMSCMKSTFLNTSKEWTAFSDFPAPPEFANYFSNTQFLRYLTMYTENYNLMQHIRLQHRVIWITKTPNHNETGQWSVEVKNKQGKTENYVASAVMVCTGAFSTPSIPKLPGLAKFKGTVMHSKEYKTSHGMEDKNVVVIGSGNTAGDVAVELGRVAAKTYFVLRRGILHISRIGPNGMPVDVVGFNRFRLWKDEQFQSFETSAKEISAIPSLQVDKDLYNLQLEDSKLSSRILFINDELPLSIIKGSVQIKNQVHSFTQDGVAFAGEETKIYPVDTVILATGYKLSMKAILDESCVSREDLLKGLYRRVFPVNLPHSTFAFIGSCLKFNGSNSQASELQARWAARVFAKKQKLPTMEIMIHDLTKYEKLLIEQKNEQSFAVVQYYPYIDELANEIGAKPNFLRLLFSDPTLFWACAFGPMVAYQYRLNGPHTWPEARNAILTVQNRVVAGYYTRSNPEKREGNYRISSKLLFVFSTIVAVFFVYAWKYFI